MTKVTVTELKNKLSEYLRLVKQGETIEVIERSVPIARIEAVERSTAGKDRSLERLIRAGMISPALRKPRRELLKKPPVSCKGDIVQAVIEERGDR
jgi:prevent-host-death family protein